MPCNCFSPHCPQCGRTGPLFDPTIKIDKPHQPWGNHVDVITPLNDIPGVQKLRIGDTGNILSEDILIKKNWP